MSERRNPESEPSVREISFAQKQQFIDMVRQKADYRGQHIDEDGVYTDRYDHQDGLVYIYVPVLTDTERNIPTFNKRGQVSVFVHEEDVVTDRFSIIHTRAYIVNMADMSAEFEEKFMTYDYVEEQWATSMYGEKSPSQMLAYMETKRELGVNIFTPERFEEVAAVLPQLDDKNRW